MNLVFLGPPGAGKGTQAQQLAAKRGWPHVSTGDLLRAAVAGGTELGKKAKSFMDAGQLVPDSVMCGVVAERLTQPDCRDGWILDGFPRTQVQADALDATLAGLGKKLDKCIHFKMDLNDVLERLAGRLTCRSCSAPFHRTSKPPKQAGVCDLCGGELYQRSDDNEEKIKKRLDVYRKETTELVPHYEKKGLLVTIEADGSLTEVTARLERAVGGR